MKEFKNMNNEEFKNKYGVDLLENGNKIDFYDFLLNTLDNQDNIDYFSASFNKEDILQDIENEKDVAMKLNLELIKVKDVYIALY